MRIHVDHHAHQILIPLPRPLPARENRATLHRLLDYALDHLQEFPGKDAELTEKSLPAPTE